MLSLWGMNQLRSQRVENHCSSYLVEDVKVSLPISLVNESSLLKEVGLDRCTNDVGTPGWNKIVKGIHTSNKVVSSGKFIILAVYCIAS